MRILKELLPKKSRNENGYIDEKTIFHIAKRVVMEEYGARGNENIIPTLYKEKKLFFSPRSSLWASEILLQRVRLRQRINEILGREEVQEVGVSRRRG